MSTIKKPSGVRGQPPGHRRSACSSSDHVAVGQRARLDLATRQISVQTTNVTLPQRAVEEEKPGKRGGTKKLGLEK